MEKSQSIAELAKALLLFQINVKTIGFDASNPFFKSKYATLTQLVTMSKEALIKSGLSVSQLCEDEGAVTTILMHNSGEFLSSKLTLKPTKDDPQGRGSCITYSRRYAYAAILGLVSDDDDDGNHASMPSKKEEPKVLTEDNSMMPHVEKLAKEKFKTPDAFKAWRIDQGFAENLKGLSDLDLAVIWNKMKTIK
jgi:hypothetical protein